MKRLFIFFLTVLLFGSVFAQKKEELVLRITQLEANVSSQQNEINSLTTDKMKMQSAIDELKASLRIVTDANALLENKIKFQEDVIKSQATTLQQLQKTLTELKTQSVAANPSAVIMEPQNEEDSIISVVQQYAGAKNLEDMLKVAYCPNKVKGKIQKYYNQGFNARLVDKNTVAIPRSGFRIGEKFIVNARTPQGYGLDPIYMRKTADGFKVDWEATVGYNEESIDSYDTRKGTDKIILRVSLYDPRNPDWSEYGVGDSYYSLHYGSYYVLKSSAAGQRIAQLCKNGKNAKIIVEVEGKSKYSNYYEDYKYFVFVTRIVSEDWFSLY